MPVARSALFKMDLQNSSSLIFGNLFLFGKDDFRTNHLFDAVATSGARGNQGLDDIWVRGAGPIPNLSDLKISTEGVFLAVTGVQGMFFPILPFTLRRQSDGHTRSDFGVHFDANVPGSAGCIVINNKITFDKFVAFMDNTRTGGVEEIPLKIEYS